jgi:hypothetical protein
VERECYSLRCFQGQSEKPLRVGGSSLSNRSSILAARDCQTGDGVWHPAGFVALAAKWNRCQIGRVRLDEQTIARHEFQQRIVRPFLEGDDAAEGDVPTGVDRELGEPSRACVAVQHANHPCSASFANDGAGVLFRFTGVHDDRLSRFSGQLHLCGERSPLGFPRRVVVVVIEATFAYGNRFAQESAQQRKIALTIEAGGIVRMNTGGGENESRVFSGDIAGGFGRRQRFTNADNTKRARFAGARDYVVAVAGERRVREVGVAVDEAGRIPPVCRGHFRSIQRSTGAAT